jgi:flagellin-specific chaperone FliS
MRPEHKGEIQMNKSTVSAYRISAIEGATHLDVLLACYDALAEDIRLAGEASAAGDIAARCGYSQHALLVLGHLQDWIPLLEDASLQESLACFYQYLRQEILRLQSPALRSEYAPLAMRVCETRAVWQKKMSAISSPEFATAPVVAARSEIAADEPRVYFSA